MNQSQENKNALLEFTKHTFWQVIDLWTGQDSGTNLVSEGGMANGRPMDVHWTGGLDRTVGKAWSVRVGCPMDVPWMSIGQVDWTGQWDKPGQ